MERGIYCHNWGHERHNMHPSMPIHSKALIEDLKKLRGTMVCWAAMGGGSVSLPYLEHEANGPVPPRMLYHGYMNDRDYIEKCREVGIDIFAVFYEAQGWEVPVVLSADGTYFERMNIVDEDKEYDWYGLREFTQDKHWQVFGKKFADYFPQGLTNSDGETVTDLYDECVTRDIYGQPCRTHWVEVPDLPQRCHLTCRNNPVWREYMKKAIGIMVDNGARGIQLDETETPIASLRYGGCFCKDCLKQFREYLKACRDSLPEDLKNVDLDTFDYAAYLRKQGVDFPNGLVDTPHFDLYWDFLIRSNNEHLKEIVAYTKEYARKKNVPVRVSGNIFNLYLFNYPSWDDLDLMVTELDHTLFKRHDWYRYAAGVVTDKPLIVAENPYGGMIPAFLNQLKNGRAYDLFRIFLLEAAVHGISMCVPYGGWMGSEIRDAFFPPLDVAVEVQNFLADHESLLSRKSGANVKILYSFPSYTLREPMAGQDSTLVWDDPEDLFSYRMEAPDNAAVRMPFWEASRVLQKLRVNYDAGMLSDGDMASDGFGSEDLKGYELVILPGCSVLTRNQADVLAGYAHKGGRVILYGEAGANLPGWRESMESLPTVWSVGQGGGTAEGTDAFETAMVKAYDGLMQISWEGDGLFVQRADGEGRTVLHAINYRYDRKEDRVLPIEKAAIRMKRDKAPASVSVLTLDGAALEYTGRMESGWLMIEVKDLPVYAAIVLED